MKRAITFLAVFCVALLAACGTAQAPVSITAQTYVDEVNPFLATIYTQGADDCREQNETLAGYNECIVNIEVLYSAAKTFEAGLYGAQAAVDAGNGGDPLNIAVDAVCPLLEALAAFPYLELPPALVNIARASTCGGAR